ncbi:alcohol dehydrogenase [Streptomyces viridiviolaceus]|uniref:Zinc-binding dehydrogenase n=1 Tax=Streptomyces viridiviolaceus TaxID=68282 RepID=A0ABW2DTP6_9ACTN|nr:zinc-binding dehydrogenase [Streptomyces viridiviolaceus]GHB32761.1 alcohol dehydrogenase [Streptomyces viridiviolaceus]
MRAVVMQDREVRLAELPEPVPGEGEVLVEVLACGICGSDLHCAQHGAEFNASLRTAYGVDVLDLDRPIVFGHEFVGRVLDHGPGTTGHVPIGARVVSVPSLTRPGRPFLGFAGPETPGGFAERMVLSESLLLQVPEHVPTEHAALTEPLAVAEHAVNRAGLRPGDVPLVVGCGPIGLAIIAVLRMRCDGPIVAADLSPERRLLARSLGADVVVDPVQSSPYEAWSKALAGAGAGAEVPPSAPAVAFECVGAPGMIQELVLGCPPGGRVVGAGLCMRPDTFEPAQALVKEIDLRFAYLYTAEEFAQALTYLADGACTVAPLVTRTIGLADVPETFDSLSSSPQDAKVLIVPSRQGETTT